MQAGDWPRAPKAHWPVVVCPHTQTAEASGQLCGRLSQYSTSFHLLRFISNHLCSFHFQNFKKPCWALHEFDSLHILEWNIFRWSLGLRLEWRHVSLRAIECSWVECSSISGSSWGQSSNSTAFQVSVESDPEFLSGGSSSVNNSGSCSKFNT